MVTIAFGQVFYFIAFRWNTVTGGDDGLTGWTPPAASISASPRSTSCTIATAFYYLVLAALRAGGRRAWRGSCARRSGARCIAIRENERRARFLGIPVDQHIWISWVISCCFVSLAGTLYALLNNFVDPRALLLDSVGRLRDHGGARRHALLLGAADRRGDLRRAAGLCLEPDRRTGCRSSACSSCWSCCSSRAACSASSGGGPRHEPAPRRERLASISAASSPSTTSR